MRKYESLIRLKSHGLNVGELKEFEYSQKQEMFEYARYLFGKFGGLICRTDFPKHVTGKKPIGLPYITDCKQFSVFEGFVETHKDAYTYILLQMIGNEKTVLSAYVYMDERRRLCGEINDLDKKDMRSNMNISEHLKQICFVPEDIDTKHYHILDRIRTDIIKAGIPPHQIVELAVFRIDGAATPFYKQLRGKGF